jgi:hypothetical protein
VCGRFLQITPQFVELGEASSCSLDAGEVEFAKLFGGKDPVLVKVQTDELISFGN